MVKFDKSLQALLKLSLSTEQELELAVLALRKLDGR